MEADEFAAGVIGARMEEGHLPRAPVFPDITTFDPSPEMQEQVQCMSGGFPCQVLWIQSVSQHVFHEWAKIGFISSRP